MKNTLSCYLKVGKVARRDHLVVDWRWTYLSGARVPGKVGNTHFIEVVLVAYVFRLFLTKSTYALHQKGFSSIKFLDVRGKT